MNKHKTKKRIINMFLLLMAGILICSSSFSDEHKNKPISPAPMAPLQSLFMQGNNINTTFRSDGIFNYDWVTFTTKEAGMIWPVTAPNRRTVNYTSGLWVGAKVNGQIRTATAAYASHFSPGNIPVIGQVPPPSVCSDPRYRIYYVQLTDPSLVNGGTKTKTAGGRIYTFTFDSWAQWPTDLGAPYVEVNNIQGYQPSFDGDRPGIGNSEARPDELTYMVYHDYTSCTNNVHHSEISLPGGTLPIGVEIQQLSFMFNSPGLTDMYFVKWKIINRSANTWDSTYISVFDDADIGDGSCGAADDKVGCDTLTNVGYVYNADNFDCNHGTPPPAIGIKYLQSPIIFTGDPNDSAKLPYDTLIGYRLLGLTGFNYFINSAPDPCLNDPDEFNAGYNFMKGLDGCGRTKRNPFTNQPTLFSYDGDACGRTGNNNWFDSLSRDVRFMQNSGPFTMLSKDTQTVVIGCFVGKGGDNIGSLCVLLTNAVKVQRIYDLNFRSIPLPPPPQVSVAADGDGNIGLYWLPTAESYNEFDKISLTGYWKFQGYEIYQIKPGTGGINPEDRKLIGVYDILDSITTVVDSVEVLQPNGQIVVEVIPTAIGSNSGVTRSIVLKSNAFPSGVNDFFINGQDYYFSVVAYGVNLNSWYSRVLKNDIGSQIFKVTPNFPIIGTDYKFKSLDTIQTNRIDRGFLPIVFDPKKVITARYQMVMRSDTSWNVVRIINNSQVDTVLRRNFNLNKINEAATVYDGILFKADSIRRENVGVIKDPGRNAQTSGRGWTYSNSTINFAGVDTNSFVNYPIGNFKAMQNLSMGLSWVNDKYQITATKTNTSFKNGFYSKIDTAFIRNYSLKRVKVTFGQTQKAYCYRGEVNNSPYFNYVDIPFKVEIDAPLDTAGPPRQVNVGFYDRDSSGTWNPKATPDGGLEYVYIFYSNYSDQSNVFYQKNISFLTQFRNLDILYVWWPRLKNGGQPAYQNGDILTITPYTRLKFQQTPGGVTVTEISTTAPTIGNVELAQQRNELQMVRVVPNPYYGGHSQETSPFDRFLKFMNLPKTVSIYIYTLNGNLVRQLNKDNNETTLNWDLLNTDRIPVASGIYIAYIDAPGIGTKIIKIAIFTPEERLDSF